MLDLVEVSGWEQINYVSSGHFDPSFSDALAMDYRMGDLTTQFVVGDAVTVGDELVMCVAVTSRSGTTFALGRVQRGPSAGTYYGETSCPGSPTPSNVSAITGGWFDPLTSQTGSGPRGDDFATWQRVLAAADWQNVYYVNNGEFDDSLSDAQAALPDLDWGGTLRFTVGPVQMPTMVQRRVFCVSEASPSGVVWTTVVVNGGPATGLYFGNVPCTDPPDLATMVPMYRTPQ
jgi:hypothetical protein